MDYEEIIKGIKDEEIIKLMIQLGADRYDDEENYIIFPTICHNIDSSTSSMKLYFYKDTKLFVCYTECGKMSIYKFLAHYYDTRQIEYDWYEDVHQVVLNCSVSKPLEGFNKVKRVNLKEKYQKKERPKFKIYNPGVLDVFNKYYPVEWLRDGISKEAMDKFNILYSISQNKIIIPHYDVNNNLIGIRGRALNDWEVENIGKYMPVKIEQTWYKHPLSVNLYGLNINKENIKKTGYVYIFEAEKSVLQFESFNQPNCAVAVCGSNFNKFQLKLLIEECHPKEIIICFDSEEKRGSDKYFMKLWTICKKYNNYCNFSFIYDRKGILDSKDSPSDKGEDIFNKLKDERVKVK